MVPARALLRLTCILTAGIVVLGSNTPAGWARDTSCSNPSSPDGAVWAECPTGYQEDGCLQELPGYQDYCTTITDQWYCNDGTWEVVFTNGQVCVGAESSGECETLMELYGCHEPE
jgi:hypothetical protein